KPMKYMNLSGPPIKKIVNFYDINIENNLIVIHDDLDICFPKIRIKSSGGHGGHNGIRNIIDYLGKNFHRIKIGIKNKSILEKNILPTNFVLDKFDKNEIKDIEIIKRNFADNFSLIIEKKFSLLKINYKDI
ncbi:MAG: hypothetical protein CMM95_00600, partial [Rickettsiales bacterium]|nr:hypothetical protein [Rickettsiales bacterium]